MEAILWEKLRELIANQIGFRIRQQDLQYFQQKIKSRITELKLTNIQEYYRLLDNATDKERDFFSQENLVAEREWKKLASLITNGESFFFRDRGQFDLLANQILPEIITKKREAQYKGEIPFLSLKIWSAGCSTGEEVYSLAMLISELIPDLAQWNLVIIGTDLNQDFLNLARQGSYKQWSFRLTEPLLRTKYFIADKADKDRWQVKPYLKKMISFYQDNLIDVSNISHQNYDLDLVICRNVFIYFDTDSIAKAVQKIALTLRPGGYFISGHAELQAIELNNFKLLSFPESIVYQYLANNQEIKPLFTKDDVEQNSSYLIPTTEQERIELIELNWQNSIKTSLENNKNPSSLQPIFNEPVSNIAVKTDSIHLQLQEIETLLKQSQYTDAIQQAQQIIKYRSDVKEAYYLIAQAHANQNKLEAAKQNCDRALQIDSMYLEPLYLLAQIAEEQNNYRKAKELLKRIIYLEPLSINAYTDLGAIYYQENDLDRSQKMYQTAYDILQESSQDIKISSQKNVNIDELLAYLKAKL
jgi:chemotaxis protein methyltransferase CheR